MSGILDFLGTVLEAIVTGSVKTYERQRPELQKNFSRMTKEQQEKFLKAEETYNSHPELHKK